jgi:hypothetical protein
MSGWPGSTTWPEIRRRVAPGKCWIRAKPNGSWRGAPAARTGAASKRPINAASATLANTFKARPPLLPGHKTTDTASAVSGSRSTRRRSRVRASGRFGAKRRAAKRSRMSPNSPAPRHPEGARCPGEVAAREAGPDCRSVEEGREGQRRASSQERAARSARGRFGRAHAGRLDSRSGSRSLGGPILAPVPTWCRHEPRQTAPGHNNSLKRLAGGLGFEPRLAESESAVLPLDDPPPGARWAGKLATIRLYISPPAGLGRGGGARRNATPAEPDKGLVSRRNRRFRARRFRFAGRLRYDPRQRWVWW